MYLLHSTKTGYSTIQAYPGSGGPVRGNRAIGGVLGWSGGRELQKVQNRVAIDLQCSGTPPFLLQSVKHVSWDMCCNLEDSTGLLALCLFTLLTYPFSLSNLQVSFLNSSNHFSIFNHKQSYHHSRYAKHYCIVGILVYCTITP